MSCECGENVGVTNEVLRLRGGDVLVLASSIAVCGGKRWVVYFEADTDTIILPYARG